MFFRVRRSSRVVEGWKRDVHDREVTRNADLDVEPHGLGFLSGFDMDVATRRASLRFLRAMWYPCGFQITVGRRLVTVCTTNRQSG